MTIIYPEGTNPRWVRCAHALGRRPNALEFMIWNERCWREFATLHRVKSYFDRALILSNKLGEDVTRNGGAFDKWQHEQVITGHWKDLP